MLQCHVADSFVPVTFRTTMTLNMYLICTLCLAAPRGVYMRAVHSLPPYEVIGCWQTWSAHVAALPFHCALACRGEGGLGATQVNIGSATLMQDGLQLALPACVLLLYVTTVSSVSKNFRLYKESCRLHSLPSIDELENMLH